MSKQHKIRWRKVDTEKARKAVKRFNAKIDYQKKAHPELADVLPEKMKLSDIEKDVATRGDFNRKMKRLSAFGKRGAEKVVTNSSGERATIWRIEETKKAVRRINEQRQKEREKVNAAPVYVDGKPQTNVQRMAEKQTQKPIKFDFEKSKKGEFERFAKWAEREMTDFNRQNAPTLFINNLAEILYSSFSSENASNLLKLYYAVGAETLLQLYHDGHDELSPEWQYSEPIEEEEKVERIKEVLTQYVSRETMEAIFEKS